MTTNNPDIDEPNRFWQNAAKPAYQGLERNRSYAIDADAMRSLAALYKAAQQLSDEMEAGATFSFAVKELANLGANVLQSSPTEPPPKPQPWVDEVTGQPLPSPFQIENETARRKALVTLAKADPALFEHFKAMHDDAYGHILKLREAEAKRLREKSFTYGSDEIANNVFLKGDLTAQGKFTRDHPELAEVYRREAQPVSLKLNVTQRGQLTKHPRLAAIVARAQEIEQGWKAAEREQLRREQQELEARRRALGEAA
jgi:hypothetical protein